MVLEHHLAMMLVCYQTMLLKHNLAMALMCLHAKSFKTSVGLELGLSLGMLLEHNYVGIGVEAFVCGGAGTFVGDDITW